MCYCELCESEVVKNGGITGCKQSAFGVLQFFVAGASANFFYASLVFVFLICLCRHVVVL